MPTHTQTDTPAHIHIQTTDYLLAFMMYIYQNICVCECVRAAKVTYFKQASAQQHAQRLIK